MGLLKIVIAVFAIGIMEIITKFEDKQEKQCFEIAMAILFAGWIINGQW